MEDEKLGRARWVSPGQRHGQSACEAHRAVQSHHRSPSHREHPKLSLPWSFLLMLSMALPSACDAICPARCTCDDEALTTACEFTQLEVVPIQLNPRVETINLRGNRISHVHFTLEFYSHLRYFDVSLNRIQSLGLRNFDLQHKLLSLNASGNEIDILEPKAFQGLHSLRVLDVSNNLLESLDDEVLLELENLWELHLSGNRIQYVSDNAFVSLVNLRVLRLEGNRIEDIPTASLHRLPSLRDLSLGNNLMAYVAENAFPTLEEMASLALDSNSISEIHPAAFDGLQSLQTLDLRDNNLTSIPTSQLSKLTRLNELDLSGNDFHFVGPVAFQSLFELRSLWLSRLERLSHVHSRAFVDNIRLERLAMDENKHLRKLPVQLFQGNPLITDISFRDNSLTSLSSAHFPLRQLHSLSLSNNPLHCNCSILWLWRELHKVNSTPRIDDVTCGSPPQLQGFYVLDLPESDVLCETPWMAVLMVTVSLLGLFIVTCIILFFLSTGKCCKESDATLTQNGSVKDPAVFQHAISTWDTAKQLDDSYENEYMDVSMISTKSAPIVYV